MDGSLRPPFWSVFVAVALLWPDLGWTLVAAMLPYSLAFLVSGLLMTVAWVWLQLPVGPGAPVGFVLPQ